MKKQAKGMRIGLGLVVLSVMIATGFSPIAYAQEPIKWSETKTYEPGDEELNIFQLPHDLPLLNPLSLFNQERQTEENENRMGITLSAGCDLILYSNEDIDTGRGFSFLASGGKTEIGISYKKTLARGGGQEFYELELYTISIGRKIPLREDVNLLIGVTYNIPRILLCSTYPEAAYLKMGGDIGYHQFPPPPEYINWNWGLELKAGIGAYIGIDTTLWKITKNLNLNLSLVYCWLTLEERIECVFNEPVFDDVNTGRWYETYRYEGYSSLEVRLTITPRKK